MTIIVTVTNTGRVAGTEVIQAYISAPNSPTHRPVVKLHGFEKVYLQPGEVREVEVAIYSYAGSFWDEAESRWKMEAGTYEVKVGTGDGLQLIGKLEVAATRFWLGV